MAAPSFLPFDTDDDSVIGRHSFTTELSTGANAEPTAFPGATITRFGSTGSHHSVFGLNIGTDDGYDIRGLDDIDQFLTKGGQISFEVERDWICRGDLTATNGSVGDELAATQVAFSHARDNNSVQGSVSKKTSHLIDWFLNNNTACDRQWTRFAPNTATRNQTMVHSANKGRFVRVSIATWGGGTGGTMVLAIDNFVTSCSTRSDFASDIFSRLAIGSDRGVGNFMTNHYFRNLIIALKPPVFPVHPDLSHLAVFGDSLVGGTDSTVESNIGTEGSGQQDSTFCNSIERALANRGLYCGKVTRYTSSGDTISTAIPAKDTLHNYIATVLAEKPTMMVLRGGTNDAASLVGGVLNPDFETDLDTLVDTILASTSSVRKLVIMDVPTVKNQSIYDNATYRTSVDLANQIIQGAPARWDAANPSDTGRVFVAPCFASMGGHNPPVGTGVGKFWLDNNDIHPVNAGPQVMAECAVAGIIQALYS